MNNSTPSLGYKLRARVLENDIALPSSMSAARKPSRGSQSSVNLKTGLTVLTAKDDPPEQWDVEIPTDLSSLVRCQGGHCFLGITYVYIIYSFCL